MTGNREVMKTPLQELLEWESNLSQMFDSDQRIAMAVLTYIRDNREEMIEKENKLIKNENNDLYSLRTDLFITLHQTHSHTKTQW